MLDGCNGPSICSFIFVDDAVSHEPLAGDRMLPVCQACKVLLVHTSGQPELVSELAVPLAQNSLILLPVVLFGGGELFSVIRLGLRCRQRF